MGTLDCPSLSEHLTQLSIAGRTSAMHDLSPAGKLPASPPSGCCSLGISGTGEKHSMADGSPDKKESDPKYPPARHILLPHRTFSDSTKRGTGVLFPQTTPPTLFVYKCFSGLLVSSIVLWVVGSKVPVPHHPVGTERARTESLCENGSLPPPRFAGPALSCRTFTGDLSDHTRP